MYIQDLIYIILRENTLLSTDTVIIRKMKPK